MYNTDVSVDQAFKNAKELFNNRVVKHNSDGLLLTEYAKKCHPYLKFKALTRMNAWERILSKRL